MAGFTQSNKNKTKYPYVIVTNMLVSKHISGLKILPKAKALRMRQTRYTTRETSAFVLQVPQFIPTLCYFMFFLGS